MTLRSTARSAFYLARDGFDALRRFVDGKAVNGYDDHMAGLLDEAGRAGQRSGLRVAEALAERERQLFERGAPGIDCPVHGQWCQTPGPAPWCRQSTQISAAPVLSPDVSADSPAHGSPSPEAGAGHPPTFTATELVDAAGAVTRMALLRGVASGNVAYWLALSAKFYDAADAIGDASTPPEYTSQLARIGYEALHETLGNDPGSVHDRALRQRISEDERQK